MPPRGATSLGSQLHGLHLQVSTSRANLPPNFLHSWEESEKWGSSTMAESDLGFGGFVGGPTSPHTPPARGHIDGLPELGSMHASALCAHPTRQL